MYFSISSIACSGCMTSERENFNGGLSVFAHAPGRFRCRLSIWITLLRRLLLPMSLRPSQLLWSFRVWASRSRDSWQHCCALALLIFLRFCIVLTKHVLFRSVPTYRSVWKVRMCTGFWFCWCCRQLSLVPDHSP